MTTTWVPANSFGFRLMAIRRELDLTVEEAAARCGLKPSTWSTWERGVATPQRMADVVDKIAAGLRRDDGAVLDRDYLMWGDDGSGSKSGWTSIPADQKPSTQSARPVASSAA